MIGGMRNRVKIQSETTGTDTGGGYSLTWADVSTMWACIEPAGGREVSQGQQLQMRVTHKFTTRNRSDVTTGNRLLWGTRAFNVRLVMDPYERGKYTTILAEEGGAT
tara:strand:- start:254 stop:574 length:321 start_codon:yes stop_codon:yes gene_type:complete